MADARITITRTFEYKLRTNNAFIAACEGELEHSRQIYNAALQERISAYRIAGKSLNFVAQSRSLTEARTLPEVKAHLRQESPSRQGYLGCLVGTFFRMLREKAESAGREFEAVNPRYTSQTCSRCGHRQPMPLAVRVFVCESCGHRADRDLNAAENIRMAGQARTQALGDGAPEAPKPECRGLVHSMMRKR